MKNKIIFLTILISFFLIPYFAFADGGMIVWPPKVHLDQSAQNAIVAWNGEEEIIILSNDVKSDTEATALRMVPLPSNPSEIKEGSFESFEKITEIMNEKIEKMRDNWLMLGKGAEGAPTQGVEITFHEQIGAHDVTVVKVNDLDYFLNWLKDFAEEKGLEVKEISSEFKQGISNYLKRDIKYFVFDVIDTKEGEESIKPLVYKFKTDYLYYPLLISGISEIGQSRADIHVFLITENSIPEMPFKWNLGYSEVELTSDELNQVSEEIAELFDKGAKARKFELYNYLRNIERDLMVYLQVWKRNLNIGSSGEDVINLQKILINERVWDSEVEATGYFGPITKNALANFQDKYNYEILKPISLEKGTGYFGSKTIEYLEKSSVKISVSVKEEIPNRLYCEQDNDCVGDVCCHANSCVNIDNRPDCVGAICTMVEMPCTLDVGANKCNRVQNRCTFVLGEEYKNICQKQITIWTQNLSLGMSGDNVKKLQEILITEEVWQRPEVEATGYFGSITRAAVIRFQEEHSLDILEPVGLNKGTGFVGPSTRAYLEKMVK